MGKFHRGNVSLLGIAGGSITCTGMSALHVYYLMELWAAAGVGTRSPRAQVPAW
jgi:hypothetical protein